MPKDIPACSSREIENALRRLGFVRGRRTPGGHQTYSRKVEDRTYTTVVPMAKKRVPKGTLTKILELANLTPEEFGQAFR